LEWQELPGKKASRIKAVHGFVFDDTLTWAPTFQWLAEMALKFRKVFSKEWENENT